MLVCVLYPAITGDEKHELTDDGLQIGPGALAPPCSGVIDP